MSYFENVFNSIFLITVVVACFLHLAGNVDKHSSHCERFGFTFTGAGALGLALTPWAKSYERFQSFESIPFDLLMHIGMFLIACSLVQGKIRAIFASIPGLHWTDRRRSRAQ